MNYEKKYKDSLEKARYVLHTVETAGCVMHKDLLEEIFPELAESEDERIRKGLIQHLKELRDWKGGTMSPIKVSSHYDAWIAHLEKQKESLHILGKCKENPDSFTDEDEKIREELVAFFAEDVRGYYWHDLDVADILAWLEKQKEQKPVEPSNKELIKHQKELYNFKVFAAKQAKEHHISFVHDFEWNNFCAEIMSYFNQPVEWKDEYREEDIQTRFAFYTYKDDPSTLYLSNVFVEEASRNYGFGTRILKAAEKAAEAVGATTISLKVKQDSPANAWYRKRGYGYVAFEDGYDWLEKNLEYMKPAKQEWSEEDEKMLTDISWAIRHCAYDDKKKERVMKWFNDDYRKSLRPQTKPEAEGDNETEIQKAYREGKNAGRKEVFDHPEEYGLQLRRMYDYETGKRNPEWSEEDEEIFNNIIEKAKGGHWIEVNEITWLINRFNSLRPSCKPKHCWEQMEWTDTDLEEFTENVRHIITDKLTTISKNANGCEISCSVAIDDKTAKEIANAIIFCIGSRPYWKPSEEQMIALDGCLEHWNGNKCQKKILESLFEQLKTL